MTDSQQQIKEDRAKLSELEQDIDEARRQTGESKSEPRYVDSGTIGVEFDDQTIAPPG